LNAKLTLESIDDLNYVKMCFNETMRIESAITNSTIHCFTEDVQLGKYKIKKNDIVYLAIDYVHHDPK
jgi:cytochrome P450